MKKPVLLFFALVVAYTAPSQAAEIKIEGGGTAITTVFKPIKKNFERYHSNTLSIVQSTAIKGLIALDQGKIDAATGAHPLEDLVSGAEKAGFKIDTSNLVATEIEDNRLVVICNKTNPVSALSKAQLKGIFTGKISSWKEVGGADLPIEAVWGKETLGQNVQFTRVALDGEPVTDKKREATTYRNISETVSQLPGGIGVIPLEITSPVTRSIDTMVITSPIYVITKGKPSRQVQEVIDFYQKEYAFMR